MFFAVNFEEGELFPEVVQHGRSFCRWWVEVGKRFKVSERVRGLVMLNCIMLLYGSNMSVVKGAQASMDPALFGVGRFAMATLALLPFLIAAFKDPHVRAAGAEVGVLTAAGFLAQSYGLVTTDAGRACLISSITAIEVPMIAGLLGARIPIITWFGALAAICGISLLENSTGDPSLMGDFWTMVSALIFGVCMLRFEYHTKRLPPNANLPFTAMQLVVITAAHVFWVLVTNADVGDILLLKRLPLTLSFSSVPWLSMVYTGVVSTAFCWWLEYIAFRDVSATEAAMVYTLEPVYGSLFAWVLLGERWTLQGWLGAGLTLGGSLAIQVFGRAPEESSESSIKSLGLVNLTVHPVLDDVQANDAFDKVTEKTPFLINGDDIIEVRMAS